MIGPYTQKVIDKPSLLFGDAWDYQLPWSWDAFVGDCHCQYAPIDQQHNIPPDVITRASMIAGTFLIPSEEFLEWMFTNDVKLVVYHCWRDGVAILFLNMESVAFSKLRWEFGIDYARSSHERSFQSSNYFPPK